MAHTTQFDPCRSQMKKEDVMNKPVNATDVKSRKHIPNIKISQEDDKYQISIAVGNGSAHPNTNMHHIAWIKVYFHPSEERFPCMIGKFDFTAHGVLDTGVNLGAIYTHPEVVCFLRTGKPGTILASSYCNVHGVWSGTAELGNLN